MLVGFAVGFALAAAIGAVIGWWLRRRLVDARAATDVALDRARRTERLGAASDPVLILAADGAVREMNAAAEALVEQIDDQAAPSLIALAHPDDRDRLAALLDPTAPETPARRADVVRIAAAGGAWHPWEAAVLGTGPGVVADEEFVVRLRDIAEREALHVELAAQRLHDQATGLPTRSLFFDRLTHATALAARRAEALAVFLFDPGIAEDVPTLPNTGEQLAVPIARRIQLALRHGDTVARLEVGRYAVLLEALHDVLDAAAVAERILDRFLAPLRVGGAQVLLAPRIGIALTGGHERPEDLLLQAEAALVTLGRGNLGPYAVFDPTMSLAVVDQPGLETELRRALTNGEVRLLYQPVVRLADGGAVAYEAAPIWQHPHRGLVPAAELVAIAEAIGMISHVQEWGLVSVCRQVADWLAQRPADVPLVCLDVASQPFRHPGLAGDVARVLHEAGVSPQHLRLEVGQELVLDDLGSTVMRLQALKGIGVQVAIDGFGTGYAALGFLQRCPVDCLKIGASYVAGLGVNPDDSAIVQAALAFARGLEIPVVAVGVETETQREELRRLGCAYAQGSLVGPPRPADQVLPQRLETVPAKAGQASEPEPPITPEPGRSPANEA